MSSPFTTELDAINLVLRSTQTAPISNLKNLTSIARQAQILLDQAARELFIEGYPFNTEYMEVSVDKHQEIKLPYNVMVMTIEYNINNTSYRNSKNRYVLRNGRVYDRVESSYKLPTGLKMRIRVSRWLDWPERSENASQLIIAKASLDFSQSRISDAEAYANLAREYDKAKRRFLMVEANNNLSSVFDSSNITSWDDPRWAVVSGFDWY